jgi:hypothetical protein
MRHERTKPPELHARDGRGIDVRLAAALRKSVEEENHTRAGC